MGCWSVAYENAKTAKLFAKRMKSPWIAKVKYEEQFKYYAFDAPDLYQLCGDDWLFEDLGAKADRSKKDFDIRPLVKRHMVHWLKGELEADAKAIDIVRAAVGMKPAAKPKASVKTKTPAKKKMPTKIVRKKAVRPKPKVTPAKKKAAKKR